MSQLLDDVEAQSESFDSLGAAHANLIELPAHRAHDVGWERGARGCHADDDLSLQVVVFRPYVHHIPVATGLHESGTENDDGLTDVVGITEDGWQISLDGDAQNRAIGGRTALQVGVMMFDDIGDVAILAEHADGARLQAADVQHILDHVSQVIHALIYMSGGLDVFFRCSVRQAVAAKSERLGRYGASDSAGTSRRHRARQD